MEKKDLKWFRLDNAGLIYPAARRRNWNNMFRLSATLKDEIDRDALQLAVNHITGRFPFIAARIRKGFFWYYIEQVEKAPKVRIDDEHPLYNIKFKEMRKCAFRVLYYKNRIAVELYHSLTDGNGGMVFLKTLLAEYIRIKFGVNVPCEKGVADINEDYSADEAEDSFIKYTGKERMSRSEPDSYHITGTVEENRFLNLISGTVDVDEIRKLAKEKNASITELIVSIMILSILRIEKKENDRHSKNFVKILIPVNLRKMFPSRSLRNFVSYITPGVDPKLGEYKLDEIIDIVHHQMKLEFTEKKMKSKIATNVLDELNPVLRVVPRGIKNLAMKFVYHQIGESKSSLTCSNLGRVELPEIMNSYIERFDFILGAQLYLHNNCGIISYKDRMTINFTRNIVEPKLEYEFFRYLRKLGVHVKIESNERVID